MEQPARRYQGFEHLAPALLPPAEPTSPSPRASGCFRWKVPRSAVQPQRSDHHAVGNLDGPEPEPQPDAGLPNHFRTFFGLGFLDVHVEMTVDAAQNVTTLIRIHTGAQVALPVRPGDAISATLCLQTNSAGTAFYGLANETTSQTVNLTIDTGFPPAVTINAGISRGSQFNGPPDPLARFGVVYFDELVAFTTSGTRLLTDGDTDHDGRLQRSDTGDTTEAQRDCIQGDLRGRLEPTATATPAGLDT